MKIEIQQIPVTCNQLRHLHWAAKRNEVVRWKHNIMAATGQASGPRRKVKAWVRFDVFRRKLQDWDNQRASLKPVIDALTQTGWIWDDNHTWFSGENYEWLCEKGEERTTIEIAWEVPHGR